MTKVYVPTLSLLIIFCLKVNGQTQWRFHVAFEDGTGQRDTLWMIYDSSATNGVDTSLGEGYTPLDHTRFNVWLWNQSSDTTKVKALSFSSFPSHELINIDAINVTYPITIRWDTSLFRSPNLPIDSPTNRFINIAEIDNDYFWGVNNDPSLQAYNMLLTDSAFAPSFNFGSRSHFPMSITFWNNPIISVDEVGGLLRIYPNPGSDVLIIDSSKPVQSIRVHDYFNKQVISISEVYLNSVQINTKELPSGFYVIHVQLEPGKTRTLKYIKR